MYLCFNLLKLVSDFIYAKMDLIPVQELIFVNSKIDLLDYDRAVGVRQHAELFNYSIKLFAYLIRD